MKYFATLEEKFHISARPCNILYLLNSQPWFTQSRLSAHHHNIASSSSFFNFARIFSVFSLVFRISKLLELKEFNKTIIPFALVGCETGYSQLGATRLVGYLPALMPAHGIIVKYPASPSRIMVLLKTPGSTTLPC